MMSMPISSNYFKLIFFSIFTSFIAYGFTLSNFSLTIDSEQVFYPDISMPLGRWGTNLIRYHIFGGILPYFILLISLIFLSLAAVEISRLFKLGNIASYLFCALFLTFPQLAYQMVFTMQADVVGLGFLTGAFTVTFFIKSLGEGLSVKGIAYFIVSSLLFMFTIGLYQALSLIPIAIYGIVLFQNTFSDSYSLKKEIKNTFLFCLLSGIAATLYFVSVKLLCPPGAGIASSYTGGSSDNMVGAFVDLVIKNLKGKAFYGEKAIILVPIIALILIIKFAIMSRKKLLLRILLLLFIVIFPFTLAFFINTGYYPPRLYVTSGISFAFLITIFLSDMKFSRPALILGSVVTMANIYFITMLFWSNHRVFNHDINIARGIDNTIKQTYPDFDPQKDYVYFYGSLPYAEHEKFRLPDSEVFGGSFFLWDGGSNNRIVNFMKFTDVAHYKEIDNIGTFNKIKDSISTIPVWPKKGYVKRVDNVMVVRLGEAKGAPLWVEM